MSAVERPAAMASSTAERTRARFGLAHVRQEVRERQECSARIAQILAGDVEGAVPPAGSNIATRTFPAASNE